MTSPRIVLDTNVFLAAIRSPHGASFRLLQLLNSGMFTICLSVALLLEYEDVAKRNLDEINLTIEDVDVLLDYLCSVAALQEIHYVWRPQLRDPGDEMVLELAVAAGCQAIITFNQRHFAGSERFGVRRLKPVELLREIGVLK